MSDELKPCPFCGGAELITVWDGRMVAITCACSGTGPYAWMDERAESEGRHAEVSAEASQMWNQRPVEDDLRAKWESVPWEEIGHSLSTAVYGLPLRRDETEVAIRWWHGNAPQESAE